MAIIQFPIAISLSLFLGTILSISQNRADGKLQWCHCLFYRLKGPFSISFPLLAFTTTLRQTNNIFYNNYNAMNIKGRESSRSLLFSTAVETPPTDTVAPVAKKVTKKSHQKKKQKATKKKQQKGNTKITAKKSMKKNAPTRSKKSKGKSRSNVNSRSFKPLKDLKLGSKVSGNVVDVCDFGVFVNIGYATRGSRSGTALLHISQIQSKKITNINDIISYFEISI